MQNEKDSSDPLFHRTYSYFSLTVLVEILEHQIKSYFYHKRIKENLEEKQMTKEAEIKDYDIRDIEKNMKNLVQSICKIGNVGFGYKRMLQDLASIKVKD